MSKHIRNKLIDVTEIEIGDYFDKLGIKKNIEHKRIQKLRLYLNENNFDDLIGRIIREHDEKYCDKCYQSGCEPQPNNKFELLLKLVEVEGEKIDKIVFKDTTFSNQIFKYKNYYFQNIFGQGVINKIYDDRYELIFQL